MRLAAVFARPRRHVHARTSVVTSALKMPAPRGRYSVIIFDWDGTLMDSIAGIVAAVQDAAREMGLPVPTAEVVKNLIGLGFHDLLKAALPSLPRERSKEFIAAYGRHFLTHQSTMTLFSGVPELLHELRVRGLRLAVATGRSRCRLQLALSSTGVGELFASTRCAEETNAKPHPAMLLALMEELEVDRQDVLMIGDTCHDIQMALSAGVDALAVGYGAQPPRSLTALRPRACVASVRQLRSWLSNNT